MTKFATMTKICCQSFQACYFPWPCSLEFSRVFGTSSGTKIPEVIDRKKPGKATFQR